jgi:hypothetical protein
MTEPVLKTLDMKPEEIMKICDDIYKIFLSPKYMVKQLIRTRSWKDVKYLTRGVMKIIAHVKDFSREIDKT